jgi:hypothetical protein
MYAAWSSTTCPGHETLPTTFVPCYTHSWIVLHVMHGMFHRHVCCWQGGGLLLLFKVSKHPPDLASHASASLLKPHLHHDLAAHASGVSRSGCFTSYFLGVGALSALPTVPSRIRATCVTVCQSMPGCRMVTHIMFSAKASSFVSQYYLKLGVG